MSSGSLASVADLHAGTWMSPQGTAHPTLRRGHAAAAGSRHPLRRSNARSHRRSGSGTRRRGGRCGSGSGRTATAAPMAAARQVFSVRPHAAIAPSKMHPQQTRGRRAQRTRGRDYTCCYWNNSVRVAHAHPVNLHCRPGTRQPYYGLRRPWPWRLRPHAGRHRSGWSGDLCRRRRRRCCWAAKWARHSGRR